MKKIINISLRTLLCLTMIVTIIYGSLANSLSQSKIKENIKTNLLTGFIYDDSGNKTEIFNTILRLTGLDEDLIIRFMENETANNILTDIVNSIYDYNLTGDPSYRYKETEIINLVEDNIDKITLEINYPLTTKERQEIIEYTKNNTAYIIDTIYATDIGGYQK